MIKKVSDSYKHHVVALTVGPTLKMIEAIFDLLIPLFMKAIIDMSTFDGVSALQSESNLLIRGIASFLLFLAGAESLY